MPARSSKPAIEAAATHLRAIALQSEEGAFIGSEEALLQRIGFSRSTVRQVARLLEQEGLLRVKRGIGGGYYAARPDAVTIERNVSSYLETLDIDAEDVTVIASALWVEVIRKATRCRNDKARALAAAFREKTLALKPNASFELVRTVEIDSRTAIFDLVQSHYIKLIFDINSVFATRRFPPHDVASDSEEHLEWVKAWKEGKLLELAAIADGNTELGLMAARYVRAVWHKRIWRARNVEPGMEPGEEAAT